MNRLKFAAIAAGLLAMVSCLSPQPAFGETYLYTGGWSKHITPGEYNEVHDLVGVQHGNFMAAYFVNSYSRKGAFAGYAFREQRGDVELAALMGGVYAYRGCYGDEGKRATLCPLAAGSATYTKYRLQPQVAIWGSAVVLAVRWRL